jgi:lysophospholipase L1-like esterase
MTVGAGSSDGLGYRSILQETLTDRGHNAIIVPACANGRTVDTIRPDVDAAIATNGVPDISLWFLGTNDWKWPTNGTLEGWWDRYYQEVRRIMLMSPNTKTVLATVPLAVGYEGLFWNTNNWIRNIVYVWLNQDFPGRVKVVNLASVPQTFLVAKPVGAIPAGGGDSVHPGDAGYEIIARLIYRAIRGWLPV